MQRVKPRNLQVGMIVAEPIMDVAGKVLLEAKTKLTKSNIELLKTWDVDFIHIREYRDTDQSVEREISAEKSKTPPGISEQELAFDPEIALKIGISEQGIVTILSGDIFSKAADWKYDRSDSPELGSLATREGIQYYWKFVTVIDKLLMANSREKEFSIKEVNEVARLITDYIRITPGVIGYALRPLAGGVSELARHLLSTSVISGKLAMLMDYNIREINNIVLASLLHDIGQIGLPENVVHRSGRLTAVEETLYQSHVQLGLARLKGRNWLPREVLLAIAQHHERMDGRGYPMGSGGDKIHSYAKIIAVADYVDETARSLSGVAELINTLPYLTDRFDPIICGVLRSYLADFLMSNTLELEDGRDAQIVYMHQSLSKPVIRTNDGEFIDLNISHDVKIERYSI